MPTLVTHVPLSSILPIQAILPWGAHVADRPWGPWEPWVTCRPLRAWQTTHQLGGVDGDIAAFLEEGIYGLGGRESQQAEHQGQLEHGDS